MQRSDPAAAAAAVFCLVLCACAAVPEQATPDPRQTATAFAQRRLDQAAPGLPPPREGWNRAQWLTAALALNPQLAEARAQAAAVGARRKTAAQLPNPTLDLYGEYIATAAQGASWLYGLSLDFLLQRPGERSRARRSAELETQAAQADVAQAIWQVRAELRLALLDTVSAHDEGLVLSQLVQHRQALLASLRAGAAAGELAQAETLNAQLELSAVQQQLRQTETREADAQARLATAVGVPRAALQGVPLQWPDWPQIGGLAPDAAPDWREDALIARPELVHALREYDLAEVALQHEVGRRWPEFHVTPGYSWDRGGVRENALDQNLHENELGVSLELPLFNHNEGPIGEAVARREQAARHLEAVQALVFGQIELAEQDWPRARQAWQAALDTAALAQRRAQLEQRALDAGAADRAAQLTAAVAADEAQLETLNAAYEVQRALGALEDAYRRPLEGPECGLPQSWRAETAA